MEDRTLILIEFTFDRLNEEVLRGNDFPRNVRNVGSLVDDLWDVVGSSWLRSESAPSLKYLRAFLCCCFVALCIAHPGYGPHSLFPYLKYLVRIARRKRHPKLARDVRAVLVITLECAT